MESLLSVEGVEPSIAPREGRGGVYVGLGGNVAKDGLIGGRLFACVLNQFVCSGLQPMATSNVWSSPAWPEPSAPPFYNAVVELDPGDAGPHDLLNELHFVEKKMGRLRTTPNAPRTLDLDLIDYRGRVIVGPSPQGLTTPHLRAHERAFVLGPLQDIAPDWRHPVLDTRIGELFDQALARWPATPMGPIPWDKRQDFAGAAKQG